jgi:hypothetical protein
MAASVLPPPFQSLDDQPRLHFAEFERQVIDDAGSACLERKNLMNYYGTLLYHSLQLLPLFITTLTSLLNQFLNFPIPYTLLHYFRMIRRTFYSLMRLWETPQRLLS